MIIGVSGLAGTGKDTIADCLVKNHGFVKVACADPLKRICKEVFDFTDDQLWGPSEMRNADDKRYPRVGPNHLFPGRDVTWPKERFNVSRVCSACGFTLEHYDEYVSGPCITYLTPRYALQTLGSEWGRGCYDSVWPEHAVRIANAVMAGRHAYSAKRGLEAMTLSPQASVAPAGVVISDVRFKNEIACMKKAGAKLIRVKRPGFEKPQWDHPSETEQMEIPDETFDHVIHNKGSRGELADIIPLVLDDLLSQPASR